MIPNAAYTGLLCLSLTLVVCMCAFKLKGRYCAYASLAVFLTVDCYSSGFGGRRPRWKATRLSTFRS